MTTPDLRPVRVGRAVTTFLVAGFVALALVGLVLAGAQRRSATSEAIRDARTLSNLEAIDVIGPRLTDQALVAGTPDSRALDRVVRDRALGALIVRVKVWREDGTILYSDEPALVGQRFHLDEDELAALRTGAIEAEVSDLSAPENRFETRYSKLLEVYQGVRTTGGTRVLFETYQPYSVITVNSHRLWVSTLPILIGGLLLLYVVQAPLAYRLARRLQHSLDQREELLIATLAASDRERATIAADLHDGVVQGLAGASYTLSSAPTPEAVEQTSKDLRRWVRELRSLVVTITPPALHAQGLATSLADLGATLELRGITTSVDVEDVTTTPAVEELVYRAAQEGVRNVVRHAGATAVWLTLAETDGQLVLTVTDNGKGLGADHETARSRGSVGLDLLRALAEQHGGRLTVTGAAGSGTELRLEVPA